ncbi:unnamed protein product, partial [Mesorhabditis belari]|uniref:Seven TM Receptor n=1 Tax=Mesorhabditis belari TaxID=2138241 RepID=A0AAF3FH32_9BILA
MASLDLLRQLHSIEFVVAVLLNVLLLVLICRKMTKTIGRYAYLLICFSVFNLVYVTVDFLIAPTTMVSGRTFLIVSNAPIFSSKLVNYILLLVYCGLFCQLIVLLMFQFIFRYFAASGLIWVFDLHFYLDNSFIYQEPTFNEMARVFYEKFQENLSDFSCMGESFEPSLGVSQWKLYLGHLVLMILLFSTWTVIIYCGYKVYKYLSTNEANSRKTKHLQKELFKALMIQMFIPLICNYLPLTLINYSAIFGFSIDLEPMCALMMIDPILEPLAIIYFIRSYR